MDRETRVTATPSANPDIHGDAALDNRVAAQDKDSTTTEHQGDPRATENIRAAMREVSVSDSIVGRLAAEQLATGGKMLRADLTLGAARAIAPPSMPAEPDQTLWAAAAVELTHQASLVHDDLMDRDDERRGCVAIWQSHGTDHAILLGDHLLAAAFDAAARAPNTQALVPRLAAAVRTAAGGQARERGAAPPLDCRDPVGDYEDRVRAKSGCLMALPVEAGLTSSGVDAETIATAARAWRALGAAYQIGDDLSELEGRKTGRSRQSDLIERRFTAPVAHYLLAAGPSERSNLYEFLAQVPGDDDGPVADWRDRLLASEAPERCRQHITRLFSEARAEAEPLPARLRALLEATIKRIHPGDPSAQDIQQ